MLSMKNVFVCENQHITDSQNASNSIRTTSHDLLIRRKLLRTFQVKMPKRARHVDSRITKNKLVFVNDIFWNRRFVVFLRRKCNTGSASDSSRFFWSQRSV